MKIILVKNCNDPENIEIVKMEDSTKNLVFDSYSQLDDWCIAKNLIDDDSYLPIILDRPGLRLDKVLELNIAKHIDNQLEGEDYAQE